MKYKNIVKGKFISRPNRFIAYVEIDGEQHKVHVKNTGRCKELLVSGCTVYLEHSENPNRKTQYDLISVFKGDKLINMDSQAPNAVFEEWAREHYDNAFIKRESVYKDSRFDCFIKTETESIYTEVKGVTLEENGYVKFPDAPTERGIKHIHGLIDAAHSGFKSQLFFVVQMKEAISFSPNRETQPRFADALIEARNEGVNIVAYTCNVTEDSLSIDKQIPVIL